MKGHTVPWAFIPNWAQVILAMVLLFLVVSKTYHDRNLVGRWWPCLNAVATVLLTPACLGWLGFGPLGVGAKTLAAELQSLSTTLPWLKTVMSALQSIAAKGMGLKSASVLFAFGWSCGRALALPLHNRLILMGVVGAQPLRVQGQDPDAQNALPQPEDNQQHPHQL